MGKIQRAALGVLAAILALCATHALAADPYPTKPVRIIVAAGPGSGDDFATRVLANELSNLLKQQFVVENRPGAGGVIGQTTVMKSPPDGYTLLLAGGSMAGARFVNAAATYDVLKDFTPVSLIETSPFALVASPTLPAKDLKELIAYGKANPGKLSYGTIGAGQIPWWAVFLFNSMAGVKAVDVTYKDTAGAMTDVITGRLDYFVTAMVSAIAAKDKLRVLAVTSAERSAMLPDVPSMAEAGLPGYDMPAWRSIMGPAGMPAEAVAILNKAIQQALASPDLRERYAKAGSVPLGSTPEGLRKRYQHWMGIFEKIAKDAGVKPQ
ncbi:MAG: tripartite tricarboxylate transporter substrate binding protein [Burkholderiales bacterium]